MNETEKVAYNYLITVLGKKNIIFRRETSPDFIESDGDCGYEVKRLYGHSVWIYRRQFETLKSFKGNLTLLVFEDNNPLPIVSVPISSISDGIVINNVLFHIVEGFVTLKVTEEIAQKMKVYAAQNRMTVYEVVDAAFELLPKKACM